MTGEEAKEILRGMIGLLRFVQLQKPDETFNCYINNLNEAVDISCVAIDMAGDRLEIDDGGKK